MGTCCSDVAIVYKQYDSFVPLMNLGITNLTPRRNS